MDPVFAKIVYKIFGDICYTHCLLGNADSELPVMGAVDENVDDQSEKSEVHERSSVSDWTAPAALSQTKTIAVPRLPSVPRYCDYD